MQNIVASRFNAKKALLLILLELLQKLGYLESTANAT
jgi:hypothetical protein